MLKKNGVYVGQGCIVLKEAGFTSADARDAGQFGGKSSTYDETGVWFSSQPAYYYEKTPPAPEPVPVPVSVFPGDVATFEDGSYDLYKATNFEPGVFITTAAGVNNFLLHNFVRRESPIDHDEAVIYQSSPPDVALKPKSGNFITCSLTEGNRCVIYPEDENKRMDVYSMDVGSMTKTPGTWQVIGYKDGEVFMNKNFETDGDWTTLTFDPKVFKKLYKIVVIGSSQPAFDNLAIGQYGGNK